MAELATLNLSELEAIVDRGLSTFLEVGNALIEIRDAKMYGSQYETFEAYCQARFGFTRQRAYQLIGAAQTVENLSTLVDTSSLPLTEKHVRALTNATSDPKQQAKIVKQAVKNAPKDAEGAPRLTAATITAAAKVIASKGEDSEFTTALDAIGKVNGKAKADILSGALKVSKQDVISIGNSKSIPDALKNLRKGLAWNATQETVTREPGDESEFDGNGKRTPAEELKIKRSKTVKTIEALTREFDDLHAMKPKGRIHSEAIGSCKALLKTAKEWT